MNKQAEKKISLQEIAAKFDKITNHQTSTEEGISILEKCDLSLAEQLFLKNIKLKQLLPTRERNSILPAIQELIKVAEDNGFLNIKADLMSTYANFYYFDGSYHEYLKKMLEFVNLCDVTEPDYFKNRFHHLAYAYMYIRDYSKAELFFSKSIEYCQKYDELVVASLNGLGELYLRRNDLLDAQEVLEKALSKAKLYDQKKLFISALINYGIALQRMGDFETAIKILEESLELSEKADNLRFQGISLFNLALCQNNINRESEALENYKRSEEVFLKLKNKSMLKLIYNNISLVYGILHKNDQEYEYLQKALKLAEELNDEYEREITKFNILTYKIKNRQSSIEVKQELEDSIAYFKNEKNVKYQIQGQSLLGTHHFNKQNYKSAAENYRASLELQESFYKEQLREKTQDHYDLIRDVMERRERKEAILDSDLARAIQHELIGDSEAIREVVRIAKKASSIRDTNVLIIGESGTGKEILSRLIHYNSERKNKRLVTVNCSAISTSLAESEFFGHMQGSFTGAIKNKSGFFEQANGGTLYLDEIGDMPLEIQSKLLRTIESGTIIPVGSEKEINVDVRIVASTNKDLDELIKRNLFRLDLLHRINVVIIKIPPLREREGDLVLLIEHFVKTISESLNRKNITIDSSYIETLKKYDFPGNVRELKNIVERSLILENSNRLTENSLPVMQKSQDCSGAQLETFNLAEMERNTVFAALKATDNSQKEAAKLVGLSPSAFSRKLKNIKLSRKEH